MKGEVTLFIDIVKVVSLLDTKVILVGKGVVLGNFNWLANSLVFFMGSYEDCPIGRSFHFHLFRLSGISLESDGRLQI